MAAGEIWVNASTGYLQYRDANNILVSIEGFAETTNPLGMSDTPGELAVRVSGTNRGVWWNTNQASGGSRVRRVAIIWDNPSISGTFVTGEIFIRGEWTYVAVSTTLALPF